MKEKSWSSCKYQQDLFRWELETVCPRGSIFLCQSQHGAYGSGEDGPLNYALGKAPEGCPRVVRAGIGTWRKRILADWCSSGTSFSSGPLPRTLPHNIYTFSSSSSLGSPIPITMFLKGRSSCQSRNSGPPASSRYPWPDSTEAQAVLPTTPCHVLSASPGFCSSQETWFRGSLAGQTVYVLSHPRHLCIQIRLIFPRQAQMIPLGEDHPYSSEDRSPCWSVLWFEVLKLSSSSTCRWKREGGKTKSEHLEGRNSKRSN